MAPAWGYLGASLGPSWGHSVARTTREPLGNARGAARETPSSITANEIKALPCHTPSTASAIHITSLSVPLPGRFSFIFIEICKKPRENCCFWSCRGTLGQDRYLEASCRHLGPSWGHLGSVLGPSWVIFSDLYAQKNDMPRNVQKHTEK